MTEITITVPMVRAHKDWRGRWGVQVKWPRTGPWAKLQKRPRWVWHGPFGFNKTRWPDQAAAESAADSFRYVIAKRAANLNPTHPLTEDAIHD